MKLFSFNKTRIQNFGSTTTSLRPSFASRFNFSKLKSFKLSTPALILLVFSVLVIMAAGVLLTNVLTRSRSQVQAGTPNSNQIAAPFATKDINKEFSFPLRNAEGKKVSEFKYVITNAELTREILVKGQKGTAVKGRAFLIFNLKLHNDSKQQIKVNSTDYVRLIVNNNENEKLAPDIHNDPVEPQAISTKNSRLGFAVNDNQKNFKIQVGEIDGDKQFIDLAF